MSDTQFDPTRHKVWMVNSTVDYVSFVVAETKGGAEVIAKRYGKEDMQSCEPRAYAHQLKRPMGGLDGLDLPWGPIEWQGKELTVNQAIELVKAAERDTQTQLMPFVDAPPPRRTDG